MDTKKDTDERELARGQATIQLVRCCRYANELAGIGVGLAVAAFKTNGDSPQAIIEYLSFIVPRVWDDVPTLADLERPDRRQAPPTLGEVL